MAQTVKNLPAMQETQVQSLGQKDLLEKGMATHSSILNPPPKKRGAFKEIDFFRLLLLGLAKVPNSALGQLLPNLGGSYIVISSNAFSVLFSTSFKLQD